MMDAKMELSRINGVYELRQWETVEDDYGVRTRRLRIYYQIRLGEPVRYQDMNNDVVVSGREAYGHKLWGDFANDRTLYSTWVYQILPRR